MCYGFIAFKDTQKRKLDQNVEAIFPSIQTTLRNGFELLLEMKTEIYADNLIGI